MVEIESVTTHGSLGENLVPLINKLQDIFSQVIRFSSGFMINNELTS
jgi:hypothetical protein